MATEQKPVIVVRKIKKGHGGHHGGSWKVAYADFVTAMMAFFMVMWIIGLDEDTRDAIEYYFTNPAGQPALHGSAGGVSPVRVGSSVAAGDAKPFILISRNVEQARFEEIGERISERLEKESGLGKIAAQVEIVMTENGLRIELVEGAEGDLFFEFGSAALKPAAARAVSVIASELKGATAPLVVEGHTDAARFSRAGYTNWELSADRANAARRAMERSGLDAERMHEIRGLADRQLRNPDDPLDPANRRISILLPFTTPPAEMQVPAGEAPPGLDKKS